MPWCIYWAVTHNSYKIPSFEVPSYRKLRHLLIRVLIKSWPGKFPPSLGCYLSFQLLESQLEIRCCFSCVHSSTTHNSRTWKQPKCPSTDEWMKKMWYLHSVEYYSAIKMDETMTFAATWMDLEIIILSQSDKTDSIWCHLYVESKIWRKWTYLWNRQTHRQREHIWLPVGREGWSRSLGLADANLYI